MAEHEPMCQPFLLHAKGLSHEAPSLDMRLLKWVAYRLPNLDGKLVLTSDGVFLGVGTPPLKSVLLKMDSMQGLSRSSQWLYVGMTTEKRIRMFLQLPHPSMRVSKHCR